MTAAATMTAKMAPMKQRHAAVALLREALGVRLGAHAREVRGRADRLDAAHALVAEDPADVGERDARRAYELGVAGGAVLVGEHGIDGGPDPLERGLHAGDAPRRSGAMSSRLASVSTCATPGPASAANVRMTGSSQPPWPPPSM